MSERIERAKLITELTAAYPSVVVTEQTIDVYVRDLWDVPMRILKPAIEECRSELRFLPTVAEIRDKASAMAGAKADNPIFANCKRCFGLGMEQFIDVDGYKVVRRCDHVVVSDPDDVSMF